MGTLTPSPEVQEAAAAILSARSYIPMGTPHPLAVAATALNRADIFAPGEVATRPELPPVELELVGKLSVRGRERLVYRVTVGGLEVGSATEWPADLAAPWRLTVPGHCSNLRRSSRCLLRSTVARILTTGQIWEDHHE